MKRIKALSLFSNVGVSEAYFENVGIDVLIANEIEEKRCKFYSHIYPRVQMICGDITNSPIKNKIIQLSKAKDIELIIATPPCQGMSTAGKMDKNDSRNALICHAVEIIKCVKPKYVFLENVPEQLKTKINIDGKSVLIPDYLHAEFDDLYNFNKDFLINSADYGVPQLRERAIILLVRKDQDKIWSFPKQHAKRVTLREAIGNLPSLDPEISDLNEKDALKVFPDFYKKKEEGLSISKWFYPPSHPYRQIYAMMHTPTGKSAFSNETLFAPKKLDGKPVKGFANTYKRQEWDKPAFTITMYNRTIGSQNNVHPGRLIGRDENGNNIYSDPRVLTIYEIMIVMSLPKNWNIPEWASDHFIRAVIGEGVPPLLSKEIMKELVKLHNEN
ncbi:MAG: DNA cytosine methyltransferase [Bacilli bacterium]|nr:DNA cytosine methyltransferase [Bacilli bacterium]